VPPRRPARSIALAACLLAAGGCAIGDGGAADARAQKLERLIQIETAQALMTDTGVPTPPADSPRVEEAADRLDVDCEPAGARLYDCRIDYGGGLNTHCRFGTNAAVTRTSWSQCGLSDVPKVTPEFVDCASVGDVVAAVDPPGDVSDNAADLTRVRVAVSSDSICVEWQAAAAITAQPTVNFWADSARAPGEGVSLSASFGGGEPPRVGVGQHGLIDGRLAVRGDLVALTVDRDDLYDERGVLDGPFTFRAHMSGDSLNAAGGPPTYP
jgi:hypothetical protein